MASLVIFDDAGEAQVEFVFSCCDAERLYQYILLRREDFTTCMTCNRDVFYADAVLVDQGKGEYECKECHKHED